MIGVEILIDDRVRPRGVSLLRGLEASSRAFGFDPSVTPRYQGNARWLVMWGAGWPSRHKAFNAHVQKGGVAVCWDMGYWAAGRGNETFGMNRVSVNALHPQAHVMRELRNRERFDNKPVSVTNTWNPDGHIVLVGLGPKTCDQYSYRVGEWEQAKLAEIRKKFPGRKVVFRPKPQNPFQTLPVDHTDDSSKIEHVLDGAALVVARHSNVAIDALRCGVPAVVEDGAAAAVFGSELKMASPVPNDRRMKFLHNLAWFQWSSQECWTGEAWDFLVRLTRSRTSSATTS